MSLHGRWLATLERAELGPATELWQDVAAHYREEHRAYHTLHHIAACFQELDASGAQASPALELAIFFHDVIYDPRANDNEDASARYAESALGELGASASLRADVSRLVLVTKHDAAPSAADEQLLVDIDLSILGTEPGTFDVYEREVRQEYDFVPEAAFRAGRAQIAQSFLARPHIFSSTYFRDRYEVRARQNLERSLAQLRGASPAAATA
jgi:predicted metal-dependent HD superfamily phosphohydrolase